MVMNEKADNTDKLDEKPFSGNSPKGAIATFLRSRDNLRIFVFPRDGENETAAIDRVKARNGSSAVPVQLIK
jgi:hypothetical protein